MNEALAAETTRGPQFVGLASCHLSYNKHTLIEELKGQPVGVTIAALQMYMPSRYAKLYRIW